jgi:Cu(I)/Ag(I) efflux system membrane fusion protein
MAPRTTKIILLVVAVCAAVVFVFLILRQKPKPGSEAAEGTTSEVKSQYYTCGMHPWVISPKPGNCPICGMKLVPIDPAKFTGEISINPIVVQNIGVRIAPVVTGPVTQIIRTVGAVDYNEALVRDINMKVAGWVDKLYVDYLGAPVEEGQTLFDLYSPSLYSAQEEYLQAYRNQGRVGAAFVPEAAKNAKDLLAAARTRLEYYDITAEQIDALQKRETPVKTLGIKSPYKGMVIMKNAYEGMKIDPGMAAYRIADLSHVWVMVTLYEYQLPMVYVGQRAVMTLPYIPGQKFEGKVVYIYPYLNEKLRQVNVRLDFENPHLLLKPGMFSTVELSSTLAQERTIAPRDAVIDTGQRHVAFVSLGQGRFEPRNVTVGVEVENGMVEILKGLKPGEMVVTNGEFLLDSESNMRESLAKMIAGSLASQQKTGSMVTAEGTLKMMPQPVADALAKMLDGYFAVGSKLADDTVEGITPDAAQIAQAAETLINTSIPENEDFWHKHTEIATIGGKAQELENETDLETARLKFADISIALGTLLDATGVPASYPHEVQQLHCPMYRQGQGGNIWLQRAGPVRNPFFGSVMLGCFDERRTLPVTEVVGHPPKKAAPPMEPGMQGMPM